MIIYVLQNQGTPDFLVVQGMIEDYYSLTWAERYAAVGDFELELPIEYATNSLIESGNFLYIPDSDRLMLIDEIKPFYGEEESNLLIKGQSSESLLIRRAVMGPENYTGVAETTIYTLVDYRITDPPQGNRSMDVFKALPSVSTTVEFEDQLEQKTLLECVELICKSTSLGFKCVKEGTQIAFSVYEGEDRSYDQSTNPYVIFSDEFDNVIESSYYESVKNQIDIVLVITDDTVYPWTWVWAEGESEPGYVNRREANLKTTVDRGDPPLSDAEVLAIINTRGRELIEENKSVGFFEGEFDIQGNFKYGVDFFMGDTVQCNLKGKNVKARIVELVRSYSTKGETSYVAMDFII